MRIVSSRIAAALCALLIATIAAASGVRADYNGSARWFLAKSRDDRFFLQMELILVGHYTGIIDGVFGKNTYDAIVSYQSSAGFNGEDILTADAEQQLRAAATTVYNNLGFTDQTDSPTGIKALIPTKLFTKNRPSDFGTHWESDDKNIELETLAIPEEQVSFAQLLDRLSHGRDRKVDYSFIQDSVFVLSGEIGERKFYTIFVRSPGSSHGFSVSWAKADDGVGSVVSSFLASVVQFPKAGDFGGPSRATPQPQLTTVSTGSGFAISADGAVVTNEHVVDGCTAVTIPGFGPGKVITADKSRDLAVIQLTGSHPSIAARIQTAKPELGQAIVALGYPLSDVMGNALTVSPGVVSSLSGIGGDPSTFTVSANVQPGNSGGPILNMRGEVVGVAQAKLNEVALLKAAGTTGGTVGFAIGAAALTDFLAPFRASITDTSVGDELTVEGVVGNARQFIVQIVCSPTAAKESQKN